jgi:lysophospholipase L1-like esterase
MPALLVCPPQLLDGEAAPDFSACRWKYLAEGDSWFSIGTLRLQKNSNLLHEMSFARSDVAVCCATPGDTLKRMVDQTRDPGFVSLLTGRRALRWDALLVSAGGNDLIDALGVNPNDPEGRRRPLAQRLLRLPDEWGAVEEGPRRYLSAEGWAVFADYLGANFRHLLALRDSGPSHGVPVFVHTYAPAVPRPSGAGLGQGPWLFPAVQAYGIPAEDRAALARTLLGDLAQLLKSFAADPERYPGLDCFDSSALPVQPAAETNGGESGDWINEIHLTRRGYRKLARPWARHIERVVAAARGVPA